MGRMIKIIFAVVVFSALQASFLYCDEVNVKDLVQRYAGATAVQRSQIESDNMYKTASVAGMVKGVEDWATFDEKTDTGATYYKVTCDMQQAGPNLSYQLLIFYKDRAVVESLNAGHEVKASGAIIKIVDELGFFSVWIFAGEPTDEDKVMLNSGT